MLQVPKPSHGNIRTPNMPNVRVGVQASADAFGGGRARQVKELAHAGLRTGNVMLSEAQRRQAIEDDALIISRINKGQMAVADQKKALFEKLRGEDALKAPAEMKNLLQSVRGELESGLRTKNQKDRFTRAWSALSQQSQLDAISYRDAETLNYRNNQLDAQNDLLLLRQGQTAAATGDLTSILGPSDMEPWALTAMIQNTRKRYENEPPEVVELKIANATERYYTEMAKSLAAEHPDKAVELLSSEKAKKGIPADKHSELMSSYYKAAIEVDQKASIEEGTKEAVSIIQQAYAADGAKNTDAIMAQVYVAMMNRYGVDTAGKIMPNVERFKKYGDAAQKKYDEEQEAREKSQKEEAEKAEIARIDQDILAMSSDGPEAAEDSYLSLVANEGKAYADKVLAGYKSARELSDDDEKRLKAAGEAQEKQREARRKRGEEVITTSAKTEGRNLAKAENADIAAIRDQMYANFPEQAAEIGIQAAEAELKGIQATLATEKVNREIVLGEELKAAKNDATKMPSYASLSPEEQKKYLDLGNSIRTGTQEEAKPNIRRYLELQRLNDDELLSLWDTDLDQVIQEMGGVENKWFGNLQSRVDAYYKGERTAAMTARAEKADSYRGLVNDLDAIERAARQSLRNTGRGHLLEGSYKQQYDKYIDDVLQYADSRYDFEMRKAGVGKTEELDPTIRRQIQADAMLSVKSPGLWSETVTQAEIWAQGRSQETAEWAAVIGSYPPEVRDNYTGGRFTKEGNVPIEINPPEDTVPDNVSITATALRGTIRKNLYSGGYEVIPRNCQDGKRYFYADGTEFAVEKFDADAVQSSQEPELRFGRYGQESMPAEGAEPEIRYGRYGPEYSRQ
ncbi:MAG: hypothetical protein LUE17_00820 [Planctomycetaceae bacterium]|nr:hypothetical protein [Planctomycetaceae bacterium]